ncbi:hypothetical protein H4582DRAFT_2128755 [Lactarius indigo]|nr:hypothetical protein H4582DRAFT_2128755 [Lactarius indigo]
MSARAWDCLSLSALLLVAFLIIHGAGEKYENPRDRDAVAPEPVLKTSRNTTLFAILDRLCRAWCSRTCKCKFGATSGIPALGVTWLASPPDTGLRPLCTLSRGSKYIHAATYLSQRLRLSVLLRMSLLNRPMLSVTQVVIAISTKYGARRRCGAALLEAAAQFPAGRWSDSGNNPGVSGWFSSSLENGPSPVNRERMTGKGEDICPGVYRNIVETSTERKDLRDAKYHQEKDSGIRSKLK